MMTMSNAMRAAIVGTITLVILIGMLVRHAWPLWTGETIYVKVRPVDPRDPFRGDYVALGYEFDTWEGPSGVTPVRGQRLYLQLRPEASAIPGVPQQHVPVSLAAEPAENATNLAGRVVYLFERVQMNYGIDALFVQEGKGRPIEEAIRQERPVFAEVAVTRTGSARVRALIIDGQRVP